MYIRQSSLYFCIVKIENFKHMHVQKNIKVERYIENVHCQEVVMPWGTKDKTLCHLVKHHVWDIGSLLDSVQYQSYIFITWKYKLYIIVRNFNLFHEKL